MTLPRLSIRITYDESSYVWSTGDNPDDLQRALDNIQLALNESRTAVAVATTPQTPIPTPSNGNS